MIEFQNVSVAFGDKTVLKDISFTAPKHQLTVILGRNGAGKTTLANCLLRQQKYSGNILLNGCNVQAQTVGSLAKQISLLPQLHPCPNITVRELIAFGRSPYLGIRRHLSEQDITAIEDAMVQTNCTSIQDRYLPTLSGGERQRAFLAMILAQQTDIIVLDEPTTYMDAVAESAFLDLLKSFTTHNKTVILIMHNLAHAVKFADHLVILDASVCRFSGTLEACLENHLIEKTFGVHRLDADYHGEKEIFFCADSK